MASAAPSVAGAPGANPAEPSAQAEQVQPGKTIKPIPEKKAAETGKDTATVRVEKPVLPGVFKRGQGEEHIPRLRDHKPITGPVRDPATGQFKNKEDALEAELFGEGKPELPPGVKPDQAAPEEPPKLPDGADQPPKGQIKFLGKDYAKIEDVEQVHRTLQGMHRKTVEERDYGYRSGHAWKEVADRNAARIAELEAQLGGKAAAAPQGQPGPASVGAAGEAISVDAVIDKLVSEIDPQAYEMIAFDEKGGLGKGAQHLVGATLRLVLNKILPVYQESILRQVQPLLADRASSAHMQTVNGMIDHLTTLKTSSGEGAFPELRDDAALEEIGSILRNSGHQDLSTVTPDALVQAIAVRRMYGSFSAPPAAQPPGATAAMPAPAPAAAALVSADSEGLPRGQRSNLSPEAQRLVRALDNTTLVDRDLGFARRR